MLHPTGTHDFQTIQTETARIFSKVRWLHFPYGTCLLFDHRVIFI
jgi:hypothetical protein